MKSLFAQLAPCRKEEVKSEFCKMKIDVEIGIKMFVVRPLFAAFGIILSSFFHI